VLRFATLLLVAAISAAQAQVISPDPEGRVILAPPSIAESSCGKWTNTPKHTHERALSAVKREAEEEWGRGRWR
jgi:hypothetical protein